LITFAILKTGIDIDAAPEVLTHLLDGIEPHIVSRLRTRIGRTLILPRR
jgi:hypothetical protein